MSSIVVTPPAAAARVAVSNPSHPSTRLVHVDVRVDESRHDDQLACVHQQQTGCRVIPLPKANDASVSNMHRSCAHTVGRDDTMTANYDHRQIACSYNMPGAIIVIT